MSKERLEKARKILNHIKGYGVYDGNDDIEIFEWLIEQAERVEELEELNRILSSDKSMFIEELVREQQQNQRYKQALEDIRNKAKEDYFKTDIYIMATEALEVGNND